MGMLGGSAGTNCRQTVTYSNAFYSQCCKTMGSYEGTIKMNRYEAIMVGVLGVVLISGFVFWGYQGHQCKIEAIKAGMKGEEVVKACR